MQIYWERMQICNLALFLSFTCANKIALLQIEAFNLLSVRIHIIERTVFKKKKKRLSGSHSDNGNLGWKFFQLHHGYVSFSFLLMLYNCGLQIPQISYASTSTDLSDKSR